MRSPCRLAALFALLTAPLAAQEPTGSLRLRGITLDHWDAAAGPAFFRPTLRATNLHRGRLGSDFALVLFPDGISFQPPAATVGLQAGLASRAAVGPASLLVKGGGAAIVVAGLGGDRPLQIIPGIHWGLGLLIPIDTKSQLRADLTRHVYTPGGRTAGLWSVGIGFVVPRRATRFGLSP
jgi:hypothetical protein